MNYFPISIPRVVSKLVVGTRVAIELNSYSCRMMNSTETPICVTPRVEIVFLLRLTTEFYSYYGYIRSPIPGAVSEHFS